MRCDIARRRFVESKNATNPGHTTTTPTRILQMSDEDLQSELERLRAENEALKQGKRAGSVTIKVSEKGAVSVYGLGRFPVTLYQEQWLKLLAMTDEIKRFIEENRGRLKVKE